jgi:hypothetical protein
MIKRNVVLSALRHLSPGAHVVWLDQVLPMYRKDAFDVEAVIGMVKSTNHRFRVATIFRRRPVEAELYDAQLFDAQPGVDALY